MWSMRNTPEIARVFGYIVEQNVVVVKHYEFGTLADLVFGNKPDYPYTVEIAVSLATNVAQALSQLHASDVSHNDISATTIYLEEVGDELRAKVGGFAFATMFVDGQVTSKANVNGSHLRYAAPEALQRFVSGNWQSSSIALKAGDVYALSVIMFEMLGRAEAWDDISADNILAMVSQGDRPAFGELPDVDLV